LRLCEKTLIFFYLLAVMCADRSPRLCHKNDPIGRLLKIFSIFVFPEG
jgi:hypothetical protein